MISFVCYKNSLGEAALGLTAGGVSERRTKPADKQTYTLSGFGDAALRLSQ